MRILLKSATEREALIARAHVVRVLQEVSDEGSVPRVEIFPEPNATYWLKISQQ